MSSVREYVSYELVDNLPTSQQEPHQNNDSTTQPRAIVH